MKPDTQDSRFASFLALLGLSAFSVAQPLLDIFGKSPEFFVIRRTSSLEIFVLCLGLLLGLPAVLYGIRSLAALLHPRAGQLVEIVEILGLFFLFLLPVVSRMLKGADSSGYASIGVAGCLSLAVVAQYRRSQTVRRFIAVLALGAIAFPAIFSYRLWAAGRSGESGGHRVQRVAGKTQRPTFVVIFDEFPLFTLLDEAQGVNAKRFPGFARLAAMSTWFRNGTAVSSPTEIAVPIVMSGKYPDETRKQLPSLREYPDNIFTLMASTHAVHGFEQVTSLCPDSICGAPTAPFRQRLRVLLEDAAVVYLQYLLPAPQRKLLPDVSDQWGAFLGGKETQKPFKANSKGLLDKEQWGDDEWLFNRFLSEIPQGIKDYRQGAKPPLFLVHITFPHGPYRYLPDGRKYLREADRRNDRGAEPRSAPDDRWVRLLALECFLMQAGVADRMVGNLLDALEAEKVLGESVVVITADHGKSFKAGEHPRKLGGKNFADIVSVPLFVKTPGTQGALSHRNVETIDILPTVLSLNGLVFDGTFDGQDVFGESPPRPGKLFFPLKDKRPRLTFPPRIDLSPSLEVMVDTFGAGGFDERFYRFAAGDRDLLGRKSAEISPRVVPTAELSLDKAEEYEQVSQTSGYLPVFVTGHFRLNSAPITEGARRKIAVLVNDRVVTIPESRPVEKNILKFAAILPPDSLVEGRNRIQAFVLR